MFVRNGVTKFAGTAIVAGSLGLAAFASTGTAAAMSSADDNFLSDLSAEGIAYDSPQGAIYAGHDVCVAIEGGADPVDLGMEIMDETDLTTDQVATFVVSAVGNFCPEHSVLFG
ncbi:DUF732 domain-containing protein [Mycolicibacterium tusciae]|uniref:DUF732 domain-containing protein n=1 Tax=Mycolicibacterium tusciae TaxID=75922 RepID=UPI00024A32E2|nr:DUF732 domain-containing protein [Mycolicibacterium tusciae]